MLSAVGRGADGVNPRDTPSAPLPRPIRSEAMLNVPSEPENLSAFVHIAREIGTRLTDSRPLLSGDLFALAACAYGGTLAEGAFTPRDAYDAAELGLHLHLLRTVGSLPADPAATRDALVEVERLSALLPSQTRRTAEQNDYQQFSTPAAYAGLCAWVSGVGARGSARGDRVLEPSAGTGALCAFALAAGATVHANELSARRAEPAVDPPRRGGPRPRHAHTR